ncbi:MAG: hypothetical protein VE98_C0001G0554 [candidate division Kazan bacterium GW2011_GWA1_50_15]|uniref:Uncharacterized protein n=2 Tax=Bacteria division Kazan-3B-28 TaxID=1798534 RepID=A0A0G1X8V4_UNCK3|nr:MAG: hypothetical protein VE98_C0001G0554 [candidate division Kazan bacterium GW2011_GWA1_50_15]KKW25760.1 MAG: hypothetical protein VE99_C0001G0399 [candidate division Kazan bacterium GW2011_GWC1_52_13]KKW27225.1 MAG: hypothetical protein VF00_C0001G0160 [candidate division Kazan bacterium GW2011_GWB1_52_7]HAV65951.1 hypothetical protein [Patescibacteria group bacterium]HCR42519.1 hypothetical protein [Patescibacteria group bacterium]
MTKLRNLFALFILLGLVFAEVLPMVKSSQPEPARSESNSWLSSILQSMPADALGGPNPTPGFVGINLPSNPAEISQDTQGIIGLVYRPAASPTANSGNYFLSDQPGTSTYQPSALAGVLPPEGSDLAYAYQDGGRAWYQKGANVLVIFPGDTIRSFNTKTGDETAWLQDRLAYAPVQDAGAIVNYQTNYNAEIVAETKTWVLMEFPSGGVVKVARPQYVSQATGGNPAGTTYNLPSILPGYGG